MVGVQTDIQSLVKAVDKLAGAIECDISEQRHLLDDTRKTVDAQRLDLAGVQSRVERTERDGGKLDARVSEIERLMPVLRVVLWIGTVIGLSIIALLWSMITGQVQMVFP